MPGAALRRVAEAIDAGRDVLDVARQEIARVDGLPPPVLSRLYALEERRLRWKATAQGLSEGRVRDGLTALPEALLREMATPVALEALDRAARLAPSATAIELREYVAIWDACFQLARRDGELRIAAACEDAALLADFEELLGRAEAPAGLPAHRWLAARRGERVGALRLEFRWPVDAMHDRIRAVALKLGRDEAGRTPEQLCDLLVLGHLRDALRHHLDERAEGEALSAAAAAYAALFRIPPVTATRLGAMFFGRGPRPVSWVVVDGGGVAGESGTDAGVADGWAAVLVGRLQAAGIEVLVLPASSPAVDRLRETERAADGKLPLARIPTAAMREAKAALVGSDRELPSSQAAALVLARRALDPVGMFSAVDPASLGLAEYQHDLDPERVGRYLRTARGLAELEAQRAVAAKAAGKGTPVDGVTPAGGVAPVPAAGPLLALPLSTVSSIDDLRPGMVLQGTVTSVAQFGAFVNLGLRQEGLVHVSEMAEHRVQEAAEVVRPGQTVRVRVIDVDRNRNRISLSLRLQDTRPARSPAAGTRAKAAVLRELDKFFKK
ncbi:MAG: S1 RNA-binding domain-containing protein [Deltaproteobacteria bacterium]|nr:S1 RNA-binding domain-containing protein [Deltaproteobacteria bacterium]